jgi:hypothetical protein
MIKQIQLPLTFRNDDLMFLVANYPHGPLITKKFQSASNDIPIVHGRVGR